MMTVAEVSVPEDKVEKYTGENGLFSMVFDFYLYRSGMYIESMVWNGKTLDICRIENNIMLSQEILAATQLGKVHILEN